MAVNHPPEHAIDRVLGVDDLTLADVEAVRLLLRGSSVIDWHRLDFQSHADVDRFLRVNEFDPQSAGDMERLEDLRFEAVDYLVRNFSFRIPDEIADQVAARDLFLMASRQGRRQVWACVVLKVMHIIHHLAGRELLLQLPISDDKVFHAIQQKVVQVVEELRGSGFPIASFEWSRKPRDSLITKLLAKRSTLAANIYDKLRFRLVVRSHDDLLPMLSVVTRRLIPFNYVVPGESVNHLLSLRELLSASENLRRLEESLQPDTMLERRQDRAAAEPLNEFSAVDYRTINFVADLPLRVEALINEPTPPDYGHVVFVLTEFQLVDHATAIRNEQGDSSHEAYKQRQQQRVRARLMRGVKKRDETEPGVPPPPAAEADEGEPDGRD